MLLPVKMPFEERAMVTREQLRDWSTAPGPGFAYYRPFVCKGSSRLHSIFLVGINPATPIYPADLELGAYLDLLLDYERFLDYYQRVRQSAGKRPMSRTRQGMDSFIRWLTEKTSEPVVETNVITYPTPGATDLRKLPDSVITRGRAIFLDLLTGLQPKLLLLHGKWTVVEATHLLTGQGLLRRQVDLSGDIQSLEDRSPLFSFVWGDGTTCMVLACRHFMYYGESGASFAGFRQMVLVGLSSRDA